MPGCCVPHCRNGYPNRKSASASVDDKQVDDEAKLIHFFKFPQDPEQFRLWVSRIKRGDRELKKSDSICSAHFLPEFIDSHYETKLPDGSIHRIKRGRVTLKRGAFPSKFTDYPSYYNKEISLRPSPTKRNMRKVPSVTIPQTASQSIPNLIPELEADLDPIDEPPLITAEMIVPLFNSLKPSDWNICLSDERNCIFFLQFNSLFQQEKKIVISRDTLNAKVYIREIELITQTPRILVKESDVEELLMEVDKIKPCPGNKFPDPNKCRGYLSLRAKKCPTCVRFDRHKKEPKIDRMNNLQKQNKYLKRKLVNFKKKISQKELTKKAVAKLIDVFPSDAQNDIRDARKKHGYRYSNRWLYECILMKIQSSKLYRFIRNRNILPLPSMSTIHKRIRCLRASFGFQPNVFVGMKKKAEGMAPEAKRGVLLIDEMKLSPKIKFDRASFSFIGFTSLGRYTPDAQKDQHGDHSLVFLFQPFQGSWVQSIGCFLSRGAATGHILTQLVMEAVVLIENAGFYVDGVVTDGAQWNRGMWTELGIKETKPYCDHFVDNTRMLLFFSDFPHLVKTMWHWIVQKKVIQTPDGTVELRFWKQVVKLDSYKQLKVCPQLNESHYEPKLYEKMSVGRAYQFFSKEAAAGIQFYHSSETHSSEFDGCESTVKFILRMADLIHAFSSRTVKSALQKPSPERTVICDFLEYIDSANYISSRSTLTGFRVTCSAALKISDYLIDTCNYSFVMLTRLNQDNLERIFGMVRSFCGNNDHPDPFLFLLVFRLMTIYSLVKPPKGSNVTSDEIFETLIKEADYSPQRSVEHWQFLKKRIVDFAENDGAVLEDTRCSDLKNDDEKILEFLAGYIAKKAISLKNCSDCTSTLVRPNSTESQSCSDISTPNSSLIDLRNFYGVLHYPSNLLFTMVHKLEEAIIEEVGLVPKITTETFFNIAYKLQDTQSIPRLGCNLHGDDVTGYIVQFYLVLRMQFVSKSFNEKIKNVNKPKELRKVGKVIQG